MTADEEMVKRIMDCFIHNNISENDCETRVMTTKLKKIIEEVRAPVLQEVEEIIGKKLKCVRDDLCQKGFYCWACESRKKTLKEIQKLKGRNNGNNNT